MPFVVRLRVAPLPRVLHHRPPSAQHDFGILIVRRHVDCRRTRRGLVLISDYRDRAPGRQLTLLWRDDVRCTASSICPRLLAQSARHTRYSTDGPVDHRRRALRTTNTPAETKQNIYQPLSIIASRALTAFAQYYPSISGILSQSWRVSPQVEYQQARTTTSLKHLA